MLFGSVHATCNDSCDGVTWCPRKVGIKKLFIEPLLKFAGMNPMTGVWLLMDTGHSEGTGGEKAVEALRSTSGNQYSLESCP